MGASLHLPLMHQWLWQQGKSGLIRVHDLFTQPYLNPKLNIYPPQKTEACFFWVASLISCFLRAAQLFSPNPLGSLHIIHVDLLLLLQFYFSDLQLWSFNFFLDHISSTFQF